jgi:hypothetical protein
VICSLSADLAIMFYCSFAAKLSFLSLISFRPFGR